MVFRNGRPAVAGWRAEIFQPLPSKGVRIFPNVNQQSESSLPEAGIEAKHLLISTGGGGGI